MRVPSHLLASEAVPESSPSMTESGPKKHTSSFWNSWIKSLYAILDLEEIASYKYFIIIYCVVITQWNIPEFTIMVKSQPHFLFFLIRDETPFFRPVNTNQVKTCL